MEGALLLLGPKHVVPQSEALEALQGLRGLIVENAQQPLPSVSLGLTPTWPLAFLPVAPLPPSSTGASAPPLNGVGLARRALHEPGAKAAALLGETPL